MGAPRLIRSPLAAHKEKSGSSCGSLNPPAVRPHSARSSPCTHTHKSTAKCRNWHLSNAPGHVPNCAFQSNLRQNKTSPNQVLRLHCSLFLSTDFMSKTSSFLPWPSEVIKWHILTVYQRPKLEEIKHTFSWSFSSPSKRAVKKASRQPQTLKHGQWSDKAEGFHSYTVQTETRTLVKYTKTKTTK